MILPFLVLNIEPHDLLVSWYFSMQSAACQFACKETVETHSVTTLQKLQKRTRLKNQLAPHAFANVIQIDVMKQSNLYKPPH